jgi:circadian clock protein KaiC
MTATTGIDDDAAIGVSGLDDVLSGGLARGCAFLLEGEPGSGKTTMALQFLLEGARNNERSLYITLSETEKELRQGAASHGWNLGELVEVYEKPCWIRINNRACSIHRTLSSVKRPS